MKNNRLLSWHTSKPGQIQCAIDLSQLFLTSHELDSFKLKWPVFLNSDGNHPKIFKLDKEKHILIYHSEHLIPTKTDSRPPILFVFGNPAGQSVVNHMFFYSGKDGKEHRFWKNIMLKSGILNLPVNPDMSVKKRNRQRKQYFFELEYDSPFRIGLCVFISLPSPSSPRIMGSSYENFSGVAGIQKLIGSRAMRRLEAAERERVLQSAKEFLSSDGTVVTFQKNAWDGLRAFENNQYSLKLAKTGKLKGSLIGFPKTALLGVPPTRLIGPCHETLKQLLKEKYPDIPF